MPHTDAQAKDDSNLHVIVYGLRNDLGNVHIALYDEPEKFPNHDGMLLDIEVPISNRRAHYSFISLDHKDYAIAVYHDANDNNSFDQGFLGIPLEDYAFSNNARVFLQPPSFLDAAFTLSETKKIFIQIGN